MPPTETDVRTVDISSDLTLYRINSWLTMKKFHDVEIYSGTRLATTGSRLEIGASNKFLREIFSGLADCASCREPVVLIFPDEEESTLREAFNRLSHFKSALSIIESKFPLPGLICLPPHDLIFRSGQSKLFAGEIERDGSSEVFLV